MNTPTPKKPAPAVTALLQHRQLEDGPWITLAEHAANDAVTAHLEHFVKQSARTRLERYSWTKYQLVYRTLDPETGDVLDERSVPSS